MKTILTRIKAVIFDFDGTLTKPGVLDFFAIKQAIDCPPERPILEFIDTLSGSERKDRAWFVLERMELDAAALSEPNAGAEDLIHWLSARGVRLGILSRNSRASIVRALENFGRVTASDFDLIISREEPVRPKPSSDGILLAARQLNLAPGEILVVGDYVFDLIAGKGAGATTVFLGNRPQSGPGWEEGDFTIRHLSEIKALLDLESHPGPSPCPPFCPKEKSL